MLLQRGHDLHTDWSFTSSLNAVRACTHDIRTSTVPHRNIAPPQPPARTVILHVRTVILRGNPTIGKYNLQSLLHGNCKLSFSDVIKSWRRLWLLADLRAGNLLSRPFTDKTEMVYPIPPPNASAIFGKFCAWGGRRGVTIDERRERRQADVRR